MHLSKPTNKNKPLVAVNVASHVLPPKSLRRQKPPIEFCEAEIQYTKHFQLTKFTSYRWQSSQTQHLSFL